ncbi:MAG: hypothetical protein D6678_03595 [Zetaproteobacteria bacterium]|nr:MAG: hypothetical protein D6678_03595 [Zetaproteobacteria bacterium]
MARIQRNAPCPCGSGKKYKKCCLLREREQQASALSRREGVQKALAWIHARYREPIDAWVDKVWLAGLSEEQRRGIATADPRIRSVHDINLLELLVAEGELEGYGSPLRLILERREEIGLDDVQCAYLSGLAEFPLRLYRIEACVPGDSFTVRDCLDGEAAPVTLQDAYASRMFEEGDVLGLRLLRTQEGWEATGAMYHIPEAYVADLVDVLREADDEAFSRTLAHRWLELVAAHV